MNAPKAILDSIVAKALSEMTGNLRIAYAMPLGIEINNFAEINSFEDWSGMVHY